MSYMNLNLHSTESNILSFSQRAPAAPLANLVKLPATMPRILLVDDDPIFCKVMQRLAQNYRSPLTVVSSVAKMPETPDNAFDVAVIDYDLGCVTGLELIACLREQGLNIPVVLVSGTRRAVGPQWNDTIHEFVNKAAGPCAILDAAFEAHELAGVHTRISHSDRRSH